jgi:hypothetical protein
MFIEINQPRLKAIRSILGTHWDPLGVRGKPDAAIDRHATRVYLMLEVNAGVEQIAAYLTDVECNEMAMPPRPAAEVQECVNELRRYWLATNPN